MYHIIYNIIYNFVKHVNAPRCDRHTSTLFYLYTIQTVFFLISLLYILLCIHSHNLWRYAYIHTFVLGVNSGVVKCMEKKYLYIKRKIHSNCNSLLYGGETYTEPAQNVKAAPIVTLTKKRSLILIFIDI